MRLSTAASSFLMRISLFVVQQLHDGLLRSRLLRRRRLVVDDAQRAVAAYRRSIELFPATTAPTDHRLVAVRAKLAALVAKKP